MTAIIPAAGLGTRFLPLTRAVPKEMLPIGNKPALQVIVDEALEAGCDDVSVLHLENAIARNLLRRHMLATDHRRPAVCLRQRHHLGRGVAT